MGFDYSATTEGHLEVVVLAMIMNFLFALSEMVFKFTPIFDSLVPSSLNFKNIKLHAIKEPGMSRMLTETSFRLCYF